MPTIYLSSDFAAGSTNAAAARIFEVGSTGSLFGSGGSVTQPLLPVLSGSGSFPAGRVVVMRGAAPTVISTVTSYSSYTSTALCIFEASDFTAASGSSYYASPTVLTSAYKTASASGTATWFLLVSGLAGAVFSTNGSIFQQIVGSVGEVGSGADLEISNVNVTSGQLLRISNLRFSIPTTFTF